MGHSEFCHGVFRLGCIQTRQWRAVYWGGAYPGPHGLDFAEIGPWSCGVLISVRIFSLWLFLMWRGGGGNTWFLQEIVKGV